MGNEKSNFHLDADDYVHVIQTTGSPIEGQFDGVRYVFEDGIPSEPVHWKVAQHILGFRGTEQARLNALHRLGWLLRMDTGTAMQMLRECVRYEPLELLPRGVVEFRRPGAADGHVAPPEQPHEENEASPPGMPTAGEAPPVGTGASAESSAPAAHPDPLRRAKRGG